VNVKFRKKFGSLPVFVGRPNLGNKDLFIQYVNEIYSSKILSNSGPLVVEFEEKLKNYLGVEHCVAVANATVGIELAAKALDLKGEVLVPSYSFVASAHALSWVGLKPQFVDIEKEDHLISIKDLMEKITPETSAILGVHLWGTPCHIDELTKIAGSSGLKIIFDAAHAFGNSFNGRKIGNFGDVEIFSFHATKFFNTFEGGLITTNNEKLANKVREMRNFGFVDYDKVVSLGINAKMSEIHAAMGLTNLNLIEKFLSANEANYKQYAEIFENSEVGKIYQKNSNGNKQYVILELAESFVDLRDQLIMHLHESGIIARKYFWPGIHNMEPYASSLKLNQKELINTEIVANRVCVLPTGTSVSPNECKLISQKIINFLKKS